MKGRSFMNQINTTACQTDYNKDNYFDRFHPGFKPQKGSVLPERWFIFQAKQILLKNEAHKLSVPTQKDFQGEPALFHNKVFIGEIDGANCYCMEAPDTGIPIKGMRCEAIRSVAAIEDGSEMFKVAGYAYHIMNWSRLNAFCGHCGHPMREKEDERAKICLNCGNVVYPRISPAAITAIIKGDEILLAHNHSFKDGLYSLVAGFVEPGETLEECVKREIFEEIGIQVKNLCYFGSQPWPFPDSLMLAFTADYESGEIKADGIEIGDAKWFKRGSLPPIPGTESIAGRIIRWFNEGC